MEELSHNVKYAIEFLKHDQVVYTDFKETEEEAFNLVESDELLERGDRCAKVWKMTLISTRTCVPEARVQSTDNDPAKGAV